MLSVSSQLADRAVHDIHLQEGRARSCSLASLLSAAMFPSTAVVVAAASALSVAATAHAKPLVDAPGAQLSAASHGNLNVVGASVLVLFATAAGTAAWCRRRRTVAADPDDKLSSVSVVVEDPPSERYSRADVAKHNTKSDCWIIVHNLVLDVSKYMRTHPGGASIIFKYAGQDSTKAYDRVHDLDEIQEYAPETLIGVLAE